MERIAEDLCGGKKQRPGVSRHPVVQCTVKSVWVLVLNWNNWQITIECLTSLQSLEYDNFKILILDNGSTDDSVERIRERFPKLELMELGANLGFAGGNNPGIRAALEGGADYVWLLNNDTTVDPMALRAMVQRAEADPKIGAVGSAVYYSAEPERLQAWGGGYIKFWLGEHRHFLKPVADEKVQFLTGASLLLRRSALESAGMLDEEFFMYFEDTDLCFRLRRGGWRLAVAGDAKVWHRVGATVGTKSMLSEITYNRSAVRFFQRNSPAPLISIWIGAVHRIARRALKGDWARVRATWTGLRS
jgi:hypothetical protein